MWCYLLNCNGGIATNNFSGGAGGGSGYISGYTGCIAIKSEDDTSPRLDENGNTCADGTTDELCSKHYSGYVFTDTIMKSGTEEIPSHDGLSMTTGNSGNGYAKITLISSTMNITLNPNGGSISESELSVNIGSTYGSLPTPTRDGYAFTGWYTDAENGDEITNDTKVIENLSTLYAHWENSSETNAYNVYFDANGGKTNTNSILVHTGSTYGSLPNASLNDYVFAGWYTEKDNGIEITSNTTFNLSENQTLYAHWVKTISEYSYTGSEVTYTVPKDGYYLLETWGAQGGRDGSSGPGGYGGYSSGVVYLNSKQKLYIVVGSQGQSSINNSGGGYNGGGNAGDSGTSGAGGGATHIATKSGLLSSLENSKDDIIIVSGGGGGGGNSSAGGGSSGGYIGNTVSGYGGSQT